MVISGSSPLESSSFTLPGNERRTGGSGLAKGSGSPLAEAQDLAKGGRTSGGAFTLGGSLGRSSGLTNDLISVMSNPLKNEGGSLAQQAISDRQWASQRMSAARNSGMMDLLDKFGGLSVSGTYFGGSDAPSSAYTEKLNDIKEEDVWDKSEELLEEAIDDIERRAEEAMLPVDENGNPIPREELAETATTASAITPREGASGRASEASASASVERRSASSESSQPAQPQTLRAVKIYSAHQQASRAPEPVQRDAPSIDVQA